MGNVHLHKPVEDIFRAAATLAERSEASWENLPSPVDIQRLVDEEIRLWAARGVNVNRRLFGRYLQIRYNLTDRGARVRPPSVQTSESSTWVSTLNRLYEALSAEPDRISNSALFSEFSTAAHDRHEDPQPLAEALKPICRFAWKTLELAVEDGCSILAPAAASDLRRTLLEDLAHAIGPSLAIELALARKLGEPSQTEPESFYSEFVATTFGDRDQLFFFLTTYPVLARLCALIIDRWVAVASGLLQRLRKDWQSIRAWINCQADEPSLVGLEWGERPAELGRPDVRLVLDSGERLVYAPRPVGIERAFSNWIDGLRADDAPVQLCAPRVLDRDEYGWIEPLEAKTCGTAEGVARYYRRAGGLLFLAYLLRATDLDGTTLIAHGDQPVLIRPQHLLQHPLSSTPLGLLGHTVLSTGLLASWRVIERSFRDVSGLSSTGNRYARPKLVANWTGLGTDELQVRYEIVAAQEAEHLPVAGGEVDVASSHVDQIVDGFRSFYAWALQRKDILLDPSGPLADLLRQPVGIAAYDRSGAQLRSTRFLSPRLLEDGVRHGIAAEISSFQFFTGLYEQLEEAVPLIAAEARATSRMALPSLFAPPNASQVTIHEEGGRTSEVAGLLRTSSADEVRSRIEALTPSDCDEQVRLVQMTLGEGQTLGQTLKSNLATSTDDLSRTSVDQPNWLDEAMLLAERVARGAVRTDSEAPTWLTVAERPWRGLYQLTPMPPEGLSSQGGIAIFLAAAGRVAGRSDFRDLALHALDPVRAFLFPTENSARLPNYLPVGGVFGVGSLIYTFALTGRLPQEERLIDEAILLARQITEERVNGDDRLDAYNGAAGLGLALANLYQLTSESCLKPILQQIGEHLIARRQTAQCGRRAWISSESTRPLGGFSHGAAGITYALLKIFEITKRDAFLEAALEGMAFEHDLYEPEKARAK